jgi:RNA polymerase sigma factor for flagellar operon FliA
MRSAALRTQESRPATGLAESLWLRYGASRDPEVRVQLLDLYLGLVHHAARELARAGSAHLELDELISAGTVGLVQALEGFDPSRGLAFSTYAMPRIRGAMLDELRGQDWTPRSIRERRRQIARARATLQQRLKRGPSGAELAAALGIDEETLWGWERETGSRTMVALDQSVNAGGESDLQLSETLADRGAAVPGEALTREETLAELREAVAALPSKDRLVLSLYHYENLSLKQIGEVLHVTESRVSQIRSRALKRLREHLRLAQEER